MEANMNANQEIMKAMVDNIINVIQERTKAMIKADREQI
jgi:hypothetical protein